MRRILLSLSLLLLVPLLTAPHYTNWHAFSNGAVADAGQVNENFVAAAAALDDFETRVSALEAAAQMFLTTDACPAGYNAVEDGYIKLGSTGLTTTASSRTVSSPGHGHSHSLQNAPYAGHAGMRLHPFDGDVLPPPPFLDALHIQETQGAHNHTITGTVGSYDASLQGSSGLNGDTPQLLTGDLEHITLRLCVRSA